MKDGKSVFVVLALVAFIVYVLRGVLGRVSAFFFVPIDRLLFISHGIPPAVMWMFFGLLIGLIYGSWVSIKKYRLDYKLLTWPVVILLISLGLILLVSFIFNKSVAGNETGNSGMENNISLKSGAVTAHSQVEFDEVLKKGIAAEKNEE